MASLILCDPVGEAVTSQKQRTTIEWTPGRKIATLFNNHVSSHRFWKSLQSLLKERFGSAVIANLVKENTFAPAPREIIAEIAEGADVAIVGVGA